MEASHGSMCWLFWVLTYTHAFHRIPHPRLPNAVLDYYNRIWIYLRQAPIKLQIGRSMRPTQTPIPLLGFVGEILLLSVAGSVAGLTMHKNKRVWCINGRHAQVVCICLSKYNINTTIQGLDSRKLEPANLLDHQNLRFFQVCSGWCPKACR